MLALVGAWKGRQRWLTWALAATIAVEPVPMEGLGEAINDRLNRAAAPRDLPHQDTGT